MKQRYKRYLAKKAQRKAIEAAQGYHERYHDGKADTITFTSCQKWPCYVNTGWITLAKGMIDEAVGR
jgi:hypothetical protein